MNTIHMLPNTYEGKYKIPSAKNNEVDNQEIDQINFIKLTNTRMHNFKDKYLIGYWYKSLCEL